MPPEVAPTPSPEPKAMSRLGLFLLLPIAAVFILGFGYWLGNDQDTSFNNEEVRLNTSEYKYINPLLDYQAPTSNLLRGEILTLKEKIEKLISERQDSGLVIETSLYYRDLNNGPWFSVNDEVTYTPASLLKLPVMIAYLKESETNPDILDKEITYATKIEVPPHNIDGRPSTVELGETYTVKELIKRMITESDNIATTLLEENIDFKGAEQVFVDFGVPLPSLIEPRQEFLQPREYASFLRILYNSTYLNRTNSEYALSLMEDSEFTSGIRAGVPEGVVVSNKFGAALSDNTKQLHDCGIVYDPRISPYVICMMTTGTDYAAMSAVIRDTTKLVHETLLKIRDRE